jgi:hypothetical protein
MFKHLRKLLTEKRFFHRVSLRTLLQEPRNSTINPANSFTFAHAEPPNARNRGLKAAFFAFNAPNAEGG